MEPYNRSTVVTVYLALYRCTKVCYHFYSILDNTQTTSFIIRQQCCAPSTYYLLSVQVYYYSSFITAAATTVYTYNRVCSTIILYSSQSYTTILMYYYYHNECRDAQIHCCSGVETTIYLYCTPQLPWLILLGCSVSLLWSQTASLYYRSGLCGCCLFSPIILLLDYIALYNIYAVYCCCCSVGIVFVAVVLNSINRAQIISTAPMLDIYLYLAAVKQQQLLLFPSVLLLLFLPAD